MAYFSFLPSLQNLFHYQWRLTLSSCMVVCLNAQHDCTLLHTVPFSPFKTHTLLIHRACCVQLCGCVCVCVLLCSAVCPCPTLIFIYHQVVMSFLYLFLSDPPLLCRGRRETFISLNLRCSRGTFPPPAHCH